MLKDDDEKFMLLMNQYGLQGDKKNLEKIGNQIADDLDFSGDEYQLDYVLFWALVYDWEDLINLCISSTKSIKKRCLYAMLNAAMYRDDFGSFTTLTERLNITELEDFFDCVLSVSHYTVMRPYPFIIKMKYLEHMLERLQHPALNYLGEDPFWLYQRAKGYLFKQLSEEIIFEGPQSPELIAFLEERFTPIQLEINPYHLLKDPERSPEEKDECIATLSAHSIERFQYINDTDEITHQKLEGLISHALEIRELPFRRRIGNTLKYVFSTESFSYVKGLPYVFEDNSSNESDYPIVVVSPDGREKLDEFFDVAARVGITPREYQIPEHPEETFSIELNVDPELNKLHRL